MKDAGNIINELDGTVTNNGTIDLIFLTNFGTINGSGNIHLGWPGFWNFNYGNINQASFHFTKGSLGGNGSFTGSTTIDSEATISPTEVSSPISTLTFNGEFHSSGDLLIDISGLEVGQYDALVINGSADFTGGNILFNFSNGFRPSVGDHWNFLLADNITGLDSLHVGFSGLHYSEIKGDLTIDSLGGHLEITTAVPEPEIYAMLLTGLGLLGFVVRRKKEAKTTNEH
ncbi:MAG: PEP-CTERM sorting domain-containing protein [Nitrosomonas sp.]|nr:PEP-CTERM sorting domain-containing protein [Nitrosomonas sp.]MBP6074846.1 PEP-CTERM sorting domain-containing protein [Nitrosomonas sp.]